MKTLSRRLLRYAAYLAVAATIALMAGAAALKFLILPNIDAERGRLETAVGQIVGMPVRIGGLHAEWLGLHPHLRLTDVRIQPPGAASPLQLPRVEAVLSWASLAVLEPRLASLVLDRPSLEVRRDASGALFVAGIPVGAQTEPGGLPDWLLRQHRILVHKARITWLDEKRAAPPLAFDELDLDLRNGFGRHRFGLVARPSEAFAQAIDIRGELHGKSVQAPAEWSGRLYVNLNQAALSAWHRWIPWAQETVRGEACCVRVWLDFGAGRVRRVVGDARLRDVSLKLEDEPQTLVFKELAGRTLWTQRPDGSHDIRTEGLRFVTTSGRSSTAAQARVVLTPTEGDRYRLTLAEAQGLRLEALTALADAIPLPRGVAAQIAALNPRGQLDSARAEWLEGRRYRASARFQKIGLNATEHWPGFSGLSGEIETDADGGHARLTSDGLALQLPKVFRNPLAFDRVDGELAWRREGEGLNLEIRALKLANADLEGTAEGRLSLRPEGAPVADIRAHLTRGEAQAVWKYLPHQVADMAYDWLKRGLAGGRSDDTRLTLRGPLDRFPFDKGGGEFKVAIRMLDGRLDYAPGWPVIEDIQGWLTFHDMAMTLDAERARILGVDLKGVKARIPDLHYTWDETLLIDGEAAAPTPAFLDFIRKSPVFDLTGRFTEHLRAEGRGQLKLELQLPIRHLEDTTLKGRFRLTDNRVAPGAGLPVLDRANGEIRFTEKGLSGPRLTAELLGQPAELALSSEAGGLKADLRSRLTAQALAGYLPTGLARRISGATDYRASLRLQGSRGEARIDSDLTGLAVDLPPPLGKSAAVAVPFALLRDGQDGTFGLRYGNQLSGRLALKPDGGLERAGLRLGGGEVDLPKEGLAVRGALPYLDLDAWLALTDQTGAGTSAGGGLAPDINASFSELKVKGRRFHDLNIQARQQARGWQLRLNGREVRGEADYVPAETTAPARLNGRFKKLDLPEAETDAGEGERPRQRLDTRLDIQADDFSFGGRDYGALVLRLAPGPLYDQLEALSLSNPDGRLEASGLLATAPRYNSRVEFKLKAGNLGQLLERLGRGGAMKRGELEAGGQLAWAGGFADFEFATLGGRLDLLAKKGQFTKIDPGAGRLLGVLSLQALPRRITLDFRDIFSEGFAFDEIDGTVHLDRGTAYLKGMKMNGPAARITLGGTIDLDHETQSLRLAIQPRLEESTALGATLLGGPVAGAVTLLAGKLLKDPLGQAAGFEYQVTGPWADPVVTKLSRPTPKKQETTP